ncbi:MAG: BrnA antitoxin family protein [Treponema sp.]|nr:BrnA antitoxin family protein [Treponema sp.]
MKTMTLDEVRKLPPLTEEEVENVMSFKNTDFEDCPVQTKEELAKFRPLKEVRPELYAKLHPDFYKPTKTEVHIRIDTDVLEWFKRQGKGYQTKINAVLRAHAFG